MTIHFQCPTCSATHDRGYLDGVSLFRCLHCGYVGYGHHPDIAIDAEVHADIQAANAANTSLGLQAECDHVSGGEKEGGR